MPFVPAASPGPADSAGATADNVAGNVTDHSAQAYANPSHNARASSAGAADSIAPPLSEPARKRRFSLRLTSFFSAGAPVRASLFGEILDWLLVPLLLLWPISVALTYVATKSLANAPYDRALSNQAQLLADHVKIERGRAVLALPPAARDLLRADEVDQVYYQVLGRNGEAVAGERDLPLPDEEDIPAPGQVQYRNGNYKGAEVRIALLAVEVPEAPRAAGTANGNAGNAGNAGSAGNGGTAGNLSLIHI